MADLPELSENDKATLRMCDSLANDAKVYVRVLQVRAEKLSWQTGALDVVGLMTPLAIGALVLTYSVNNPYLGCFIKAAAFIALVQLLAFALSIAQKWNANLSYYYEAMQDLSSIEAEFIKIKTAPSRQSGVLWHQFEINRVRYDIRKRLNLKYNITSKEIEQAETHFANVDKARQTSAS